MIYVIEGVLKGDALIDFQNYALSPHVEWYEGNVTARGAAKYGKINMQSGVSEDPDWVQVSSDIRGLIMDDPRYQTFTGGVPTLLGGLFRMNRYDVGMKYDWHCDNTFMGFPDEVPEPIVTNYAYSLAVTDNYEGGEFEIKLPHTYTNGEQDVKVFKGKPGDMIIFPTSYMHRVKEVTRGSRVVCNGWLTHSIKDPYDLPDLLHIMKQIEECPEDDIERKLALSSLKWNYQRRVDLTK